MRAEVLRAVYQVLEGNAALVAKLNHQVGATTVEGGARILGDSVYLDSITDRLPIIILRVPATRTATNGLRASTIPIEVHGADAFQTAEVLDLLESACTGYRMADFPSLPVVINQLAAGDDQPIDTGDPTIRIPAAQANLEVRWAERT